MKEVLKFKFVTVDPSAIYFLSIVANVEIDLEKCLEYFFFNTFSFIDEIYVDLLI